MLCGSSVCPLHSHGGYASHNGECKQHHTQACTRTKDQIAPHTGMSLNTRVNTATHRGSSTCDCHQNRPLACRTTATASTPSICNIGSVANKFSAVTLGSRDDMFPCLPERRAQETQLLWRQQLCLSGMSNAKHPSTSAIPQGLWRWLERNTISPHLVVKNTNPVHTANVDCVTEVVRPKKIDLSYPLYVFGISFRSPYLHSRDPAPNCCSACPACTFYNDACKQHSAEAHGAYLGAGGSAGVQIQVEGVAKVCDPTFLASQTRHDRTLPPDH